MDDRPCCCAACGSKDGDEGGYDGTVTDHFEVQPRSGAVAECRLGPTPESAWACPYVSPRKQLVRPQRTLPVAPESLCVSSGLIFLSWPDFSVGNGHGASTTTHASDSIKICGCLEILMVVNSILGIENLRRIYQLPRRFDKADASPGGCCSRRSRGIHL